MDHDARDERETALRPLRELGTLVASLRGGSLASEEGTRAVLRVADAVEMSLRRLLRSSAAADIEVRLRALAPDEIRTDQVVAELRQHDLVSVELAAGVHDLLRARYRLQGGGVLEASDAALAANVADRLEREIADPSGFVSPAALPDDDPASAAAVHPVPVESVTTRRTGRGTWVAAAVLLLLVIVAVVWQLMPRNNSDMAQGITLFRTGSYEDAASHFWRYAESHPDDATPHLYLARIHRRMQRFDLAGPELQKALDLAPNDPDVQTELAFLLLDTDRYDAAARRFRSALALDSSQNDAWAGLVLAFRAAGQSDSAASALASAPAEVRALITQRVTADSTP